MANRIKYPVGSLRLVADLQPYLHEAVKLYAHRIKGMNMNAVVASALERKLLEDEEFLAHLKTDAKMKADFERYSPMYKKR